MQRSKLNLVPARIRMQTSPSDEGSILPVEYQEEKVPNGIHAGIRVYEYSATPPALLECRETASLARHIFAPS